MGRKFTKDKRAGVYITIIVHLCVAIVLLSVNLTALVIKEDTFVLDFTREEELEKAIREEMEREKIAKELDELIDNARQQPRNNVRNIAVNAGEKLKDDRGANDVYEQARELQRKLNESRNAAMEQEKTDDAVDLSKDKDNEKQDNTSQQPSGPTVLSFTLDGRKARSLVIPAYKCIGGGDVTVMIEVNRGGRVVDAKVIDDISEADECLREYAVKAAKKSVFTASATAPERQRGQITYRFVAQ